MRPIFFLSALAAIVAFAGSQANAAETCQITTGARATTVIELYTSEGCNSCPPADQWLSRLPEVRDGKAVALAFHVDYWDYLGWKDRFANPQFTARQYEGASQRNARGVYTPQVVLNGQDFRWLRQAITASGNALVQIALNATPQANGLQVEAKLSPQTGAPNRLTAYWAVTEDMHVSKVTAGENARETLRHDYVVTQYLPIAEFASDAPPALRWTAAGVNQTASAQHKQRVHLVVVDASNGVPLQVATVGSCG